MTIFHEPLTYLIIPCVLLVSATIVSLYPAIFLASFKPVYALRNNIGRMASRGTVRKVIITIQLCITIALLCGVFVINQQIDFLRGQDLGIDIAQTLVIREPLITDNTSVNKYQPLREKFKALTGVTAVTYASSYPGSEIDWHRADITLEQSENAERYSCRIVSIGTEFIDAFGLGLIAGRNLDERIESDNRSMLISENAVKMFGFSSASQALGRDVFLGSRKFQVIGILENYHFRSFQVEAQPLLYIQGYPRNPSFAIKVSSADISSLIRSIETDWRKAYGTNVFDYYFLDEYFDRQYQNDEQLSTLTSWLTYIAISISSVGIFGLSMYNVARRTKEIGIRKVMGASVTSILKIMSIEYLRLVIVGGVITLPIAWYLAQEWLKNYAHRTPLSVWLWTLPVVTMLVLVFMSTSLQTIGVAKRDPVKSMRQE